MDTPSSLFSTKRSEFAGNQDAWDALRATASIVIQAGRDEVLYGDSAELYDAATASSKAPYGSNVPYADEGVLPDGKKRYPIDCKHVKAAWSYIHQKRNAAKYTSGQLSHIKGKIAAAYKRCFGEEPPEAKTE